MDKNLNSLTENGVLKRDDQTRVKFADPILGAIVKLAEKRGHIRR